MKPTLLALTLGLLLASPLLPAAGASAPSAAVPSQALTAAPEASLQQASDLNALVSKRQAVDMLLTEALQIFHSPARISHAGFTAKMPSNMELITDRLLDAYRLEPYRTDLLISAANAQIYNGQLERAIGLLEQAWAAAPDDLDINSYLAIWQLVKGDQEASRRYLAQVANLNSGRAADLEGIIARVQRISTTPLQTALTRDQIAAAREKRRAIVTLGYALNPDGSMDAILKGRLETTLALAKADPEALIVLTGGVPQNRQTEGKLMADWLAGRGIDRSRLIEENYATSTVENALYSAYALARHRIGYAVLVSSASHVRRGQTLLEIASKQSGPANIQVVSVSYPDKPLSELATVSQGELLGIYRDALRTYGLWSYRSAPLLER
ncbi:ElyC/SanA/YdcF family protein [Aeromonas schubertii]|uniref:YdcF family protein n=1 Tax=Aeromonas schubertii TaxID=652 RepID=A0ABS7VF99_9GAMM|nr:YdcF family protein [Aeromonas schubertii]MBZ6067574.1 YdcF family protein [Aeromonas schubertii]